MSLATDVLDYLENQGVIEGATGWSRSVAFMPPSPDQVIAVYETTGLEPEIVKDGSSEQAYDEPGFQVRGRGAEFGMEALESKMYEVYTTLHGAAPTGFVFVRATQSGSFNIGLDEQGRPELTWNFAAIRERT